MRGTSLASLGAAQLRFEPVLSAAGAQGITLGEQLFAVVDALDSSGSLRRTLSDQSIEPGAKASTSYAGTPWVIAFLVGTTALVGAVGYVRRRREERQPFELPAPGAPGARAR